VTHAHCRTVSVPTADRMRTLGALLGGACTGGDVIVLAGDLGAGKTTFTQGLARGLGIDDHVTSPTFVIARVHPNPGDAPDLVHVDAYRLGSAVELDDLDLDTDLDRSVVVVEWGEGLVEQLSASRVEVRIDRSADEADDERQVAVTADGARWQAVLDAYERAA
jgi:tRNA threonylcarbamoyladenosine biosynthesis protein TsaE